MGKVKEQKWNLIKSHLILMFMNIDIECPTNIDEITDYIFNEYPDWHTGNISTEFKGWVEAQSENVQDINTPTGYDKHDEILTPVVSRGEMIETIMNTRFNDDDPKNDSSNEKYLESLSNDELEGMYNNIN